MKTAAWIWIALGGAAGTLGRTWIGLVIPHSPPHSFPWATLLVNVLGSFILGAMVGLDLAGSRLHDTTRDFFVIGFCGGFTTFSTFSFQTVEQLQHRELNAAFANIALSLACTLLAVWAGLRLGARLSS